MATNYPGSLDTSTQQPSPSSTTDLDASGYEHDAVHTNHSGAIIALETKLGSTDSNAVDGAVLMGTGSGTSEWDTTPTIKGQVEINSAAENIGLKITSTDENALISFADDGATAHGYAAIGGQDNNLALFAGGSQRVTVGSDGRVTINSGSYLSGYLYGTAAAKGAGWSVNGSDGTSIGFMGAPDNDDMHWQSTHASGYWYCMVGGTYRMYSTNTGGWYPYVDNTYDLGWSSKRWDDVYATNGTIQTSDVNFKKDIADTTLGLDFINALRPVEYKWKEGSRKHQGFIAQEVKTVLDAKDVAADQAMWGLNTVKEGAKVIVPVEDENGIPQKTEVDNEERQSLRYTELIAPLVKAVQELTTRVAALEGS